MVPACLQAVIRRRLQLTGRVQGVGFRPSVYRLAREFALTGSVANHDAGATIEVEGPRERVDAFAAALPRRLPPPARVVRIVSQEIAPRRQTEFRIEASQRDASGRLGELPPDIATCHACRKEIFDDRRRRYRYPFTNCSHCGPRYTIILDLPYDRPRTSMARFQMCARCRREYSRPGDRRFHAQPIACAECGPRLWLTDSGGGRQSVADPIAAAAAALRTGAIVALKGVGGYHLACRADDDGVVRRLRARKGRDAKPLAVMVADRVWAGRLARLQSGHVAALEDAAAPIVLAPQRPGHGLAQSVAAGCAEFGLLLPYTPLHHLLLAEDVPPLVMTSANLSSEPLIYQDEDALTRLSLVADAFLLHDREIVRPVDDSVVMVFRERPIPIRRARGYAPEPVRLNSELEAGGAAACVLAVGGELKNTICLLGDGEAVVSEHIGDVGTPAARRRFEATIEAGTALLRRRPVLVAHDLHPEYAATRYARRRSEPAFAVQHHHAHLAALLAERMGAGPLVGLVCDGTGLGTDGAIWGGEVLWTDGPTCRRLGHLEYFPLLGGDAAARETWRPAAGLLAAALGPQWLRVLAGSAGWLAARFEGAAGMSAAELERLPGLARAPACSSLGRLFDAASFVLGICEQNEFEGQAAMGLQAAAQRAARRPGAAARTTDEAAIEFQAQEGWVIRTGPLMRGLVDGLSAGRDPAVLADEFHRRTARALAAAADEACAEVRCTTVGLTGGCFANSLLLEAVAEELEARGLRVWVHRQVPPGDGGLALGQAYAAWTFLKSKAVASQRLAATGPMVRS